MNSRRGAPQRPLVSPVTTVDQRRCALSRWPGTTASEQTRSTDELHSTLPAPYDGAPHRRSRAHRTRTVPGASRPAAAALASRGRTPAVPAPRCWSSRTTDRPCTHTRSVRVRKRARVHGQLTKASSVSTSIHSSTRSSRTPIGSTELCSSNRTTARGMPRSTRCRSDAAPRPGDTRTPSDGMTRTPTFAGPSIG